ncbi:MAG: Cdc6/Cdc18 family protein [Thermoprotei archaeon]|jgi:cell division control protein 6
MVSEIGMWKEKLEEKILEKSKKMSNIKDPSQFDLQTIPKRIYYRKEFDAVIEKVAEYVLTGLPTHIIIFGPRGSGKTTLINGLMETMRETKNIPYYYVTARESPSSYEVYQHLLNIEKAGHQASFMIEKIKKKFQEKAFIVIDEADFLRDYNFLFIISRFTKASIIILAQNIHFLDNVDDSTRSSLAPHPIVFNPYNAEEIRTILHYRAEDGLYTFNDSSLNLIAAKVANNYYSDTRIAIRALFHAGAENAWTEESVNKALKLAEKEIELGTLRGLNLRNLIILQSLITNNNTNAAYEIAKRICTEHNITLSKPTFFHDLNYLQNLGLITLIRAHVGRTYTYEVQLLFNTEILKEISKNTY